MINNIIKWIFFKSNIMDEKTYGIVDFFFFFFYVEESHGSGSQPIRTQPYFIHKSDNPSNQPIIAPQSAPCKIHTISITKLT